MSTSSTPPAASNAPSPDPRQRRREQRGWYVYDWANQVFITSVVTVLIGPYLSGLSCAAAGAPGTEACLDPNVRIHPFGVDWISLHPNALHPTLTTCVVLLLVVLLPLVGALADQSRHKKRWLFWLAAGGSVSISLMYLTDDYRITAALFVLGNIGYGLSIVVFHSFLPEIATEEERNRVSVTGWSLAYLGGAVLLALHLALITWAPDLGMGDDEAVRIAFASVGVWWLGFSVLGIRRLRNRYSQLALAPGPPKVGASLKQFGHTLRDMRNYPNTLLFLLAFIFFNDGIQAAIYFAGNFATQDLGLSLTVLSATILMIQFVAFAGALLMGRISRVVGTKKTVLFSLGIWCGLVTCGYFLPPGEPLLFVLLGLGIGTVLGGTQSLARALFSLLIPRGREAEYFSLYQLADRGSSLLGAGMVSIVVNITGGYRTAIFSLLFFFVVGGILLWRTNLKAGIEAVGNTPPRHL